MFQNPGMVEQLVDRGSLRRVFLQTIETFTIKR